MKAEIKLVSSSVLIDHVFTYSSAIYDTTIVQQAAYILQCVNVGDIVNNYIITNLRFVLNRPE
jgi:hypothetical protein